jgi:hypothetical protein
MQEDAAATLADLLYHEPSPLAGLPPAVTGSPEDEGKNK